VAATLKEAVWPVVTVWLAGCVVIVGAAATTLSVKFTPETSVALTVTF
jgi:hypothetical protein